MKEKLFLNKTTNKIIGAFLFFFFLSVTVSAQCLADAAAIEITGTGATDIEICAGDGVGDPIDVTVVGTGVGANSGWVITDNATGTILGLPAAPPFDLDGAGDGVCDIWYIRYEDGLTGLMTGQNVSGLVGCYDLSNAISVTRNDPDAAAIEITGSGTTSIDICAGDGVGDPIDVTVVGTGVGANSGWVITDNATGTILALPPAPPFDLDGAGDGVCDIWYIRYEDGLTGLMTGQNISGLVGCYDLSNAISVTRNDPDAAAIEITGSGATSIDICAGDGVGDPIDVTVVGTGVGANSGWVITDNATGTILGLPAAPPFDLDGAGDGVCDIWYIRYEDGLTGLMTGQNVSGLTGCFDLSNAISVTRNDPDAAAIEITGTGATDIEICAGDGVGDPIDVTVVGTGVGANSGWVITDNATGTILGLPAAPPFDLDGAGDGVCDIWYIRYEDGLTGLMTGQNVSGLVGCYDLSNSISVTRNDPDAAAIEITGTGATDIEICAGDGVGDPIDVTVVGTGVGANSGWVITDNATGTILGLPAAPPFDLEGAGDGVCDIWYIRYEDGLTGLSTGQNVTDLSGCYDLSNPITVNREGVSAAPIFVTGSAGNTEITICAGDGIDNPINITVDGTGVGANNGWVITDEATGTILGLPAAPPFNLEGAGDGVCQIWYIRYAGGLSGLEVGENVADLDGCFDLSNPVTVNRLGVNAGDIEITGSGGATEIDICAGDGVDDPIEVTVLGDGQGSFSGWVITDNVSGAILGLPPGPPFNLEGAGAGVCDIWYIRYESGLMGLNVGENVGDLVGCYDLSNAITVNREGVDGAAIQIAGTVDTEIFICAGDGEADPIDVEVVGAGVGANSGWVITNNATGEILGLPAAPPFDLEGAGAGVCDIWYIRYADGLIGLETGQNVADLDGCFDFSNPITVTRLTGDDCDILSVGEFQNSFEFALFPNPVNNTVSILYLGGQTVDAQVSIYDITGRLVIDSEIITQSEISLDVSALNSGTYLVKIQDNETGGNTTKQLIKR